MQPEVLQQLKSLPQELEVNPVVAELLIYRQQKNLEHSVAKTKRRFSKKDFLRYERFLRKLHGSRAHRNSEPVLLRKRLDAFLGFQWNSEPDDESLHDLRILTKKLRYSLEIYERLGRRSMKRLLAHMKSLQDLLGEIHDLYVLQNILWMERQEWDEPGLPIISACIDTAMARTTSRKEELRKLVYPQYLSVADRISAEILPRLQESWPIHISA